MTRNPNPNTEKTKIMAKFMKLSIIIIDYELKLWNQIRNQSKNENWVVGWLTMKSSLVGRQLGCCFRELKGWHFDEKGCSWRVLGATRGSGFEVMIEWLVLGAWVVSCKRRKDPEKFLVDLISVHKNQVDRENWKQILTHHPWCQVLDPTQHYQPYLGEVILCFVCVDIHIHTCTCIHVHLYVYTCTDTYIYM